MKWLKSFLGSASASIENSNPEDTPIDQWTKAHFITWLKHQNFSKQTIESVKASSTFDELEDFTDLTFRDLIMILPTADAMKVMNRLADIFPKVFEFVEDPQESKKHNEVSSVKVVKHLPTRKSSKIYNSEQFTYSSVSTSIENNSLINNEEYSIPSSYRNKSTPPLFDNFMTDFYNNNDLTISEEEQLKFKKDLLHFSTNIPLDKYLNLTNQENQALEKIYEKIQNLQLQNLQNLQEINELNKEMIEVLAQDLIIPERFKYKFLNIKNILNSNEIISEIPFITISLVINQIKTKNNLNVFYFSLAIGPFFIEWNEYSISIIRNKNIIKDIEMIEIETIKGNLEEIENKFTIISKICCEWNILRKFDKKKLNHQHFVMDLLFHLNIHSIVNFNHFCNDQLEFKKMKKMKIKYLLSPFINNAYFSSWINISYSLWMKLVNYLNISENLLNCLLNGIKEDYNDLFLSSSLTNDSVRLEEKQICINFTNHEILDEFIHLLNEIHFKTLQENNFTKSLLKMFDKAYFYNSMDNNNNCNENMENCYFKMEHSMPTVICYYLMSFNRIPPIRKNL
ncbi:hypothetical protein ABK040_013021 [Willaertia magna]